MKNSSKHIAVSNFTAMCEIARFLDRRGYWKVNRDIAFDVAESVYGVFENVAWADRNLHESECWMIESLFEHDEGFSEQLRETFAKGGAVESVPGILRAAQAHDQNHGTRFTEIYFNHLENLGQLFMMADASIGGEELHAFKVYMSNLRQSLATTIGDGS